MSYKKELRMRVVKTTHVVTLRSGWSCNFEFKPTAKEFKADFAAVPDNARLVEIDGDGDVYILKFIEEVTEGEDK